MSTTRHLINRQRRRQAVGNPTVPAAPAPADANAEKGPAGTKGQEPPEREGATGDTATSKGRSGRRYSASLLVLCALTLLLGAFAGFAHSRSAALRDEPARGNTALTDLARTSEIKGQTAKAVASLFSYDQAKPAAFENAKKTLLTGKAVTQHQALFKDVLAGAEKQKTVITTTVTDSAVERIDGDRARVLVFADQSSVGTAGTEKPSPQDQGVYAGAMFAVDLVDQGGRWLVEGIDTFGR
ncbi:hypothetical protein AB0P15_29215 [Streptomyces sp. NPDC087917]|uniref:hypothetical protein n=1 Tax=Streptomyces sp. NPDC087917 TaxID=3155060 RepID=UPI0034458CB7